MHVYGTVSQWKGLWTYAQSTPAGGLKSNISSNSFVWQFDWLNLFIECNFAFNLNQTDVIGEWWVVVLFVGDQFFSFVNGTAACQIVCSNDHGNTWCSSRNLKWKNLWNILEKKRRTEREKMANELEMMKKGFFRQKMIFQTKKFFSDKKWFFRQKSFSLFFGCRTRQDNVQPKRWISC